MNILLIFLHFSFITCNINITDTSLKIKTILRKYKSTLNTRYPRCVKSDRIDSFVSKALTFFDKTQRYGDFLRFRNVSECAENEKSASYLTEHILDGLLIHEDLPDSHWHEYKSVHKKQYATAHYEMAALQKWRDNLRKVAEHNRRYLAGELTYSLNLNVFGDMSVTDYFAKILKLFSTVPLFDPAEDHRKTAYQRSLRKSVPTHVDWRLLGFRPRREEQHQCGACYAFAVTHALQAQLYKAHGSWGELRWTGSSWGSGLAARSSTHALQAQLYKAHGSWGELSPQQIVDCSYADGNRGCDGGSLRGALRYAARAGLADEGNYPYVGRKQTCKYTRRLLKARPRRWATLPSGEEGAMEKALATIGPLAVGVNAAPYTFQLYRSGIYDDPFCTPWQLNHAMLLVGYTPQYWILLNWWGRNWGEDGYMRIRRGFNICGVANMATYVEL